MSSPWVGLEPREKERGREREREERRREKEERGDMVEEERESHLGQGE